MKKQEWFVNTWNDFTLSFLLLIWSTCYIQLAREILDCAANALAAGVTTDEIDRLVHEASHSATTSLGFFGKIQKYFCSLLEMLL